MIADAHLTRASVHMSRGHDAAAIESLRAALGLEPELARAHAMLSVCLLRSRRRFAAEHEARRALALEPELAAGHVAMAAVLLARHALREADAEAAAALALAPDDIAAMLTAAAVAVARSDRAAARAQLDRALAIEPESVTARVALADVLRAEGDDASADAQIDEALAIEPESATALAARGEVLLRGGRLDEAAEHAIWALRSDATSERALVLLAGVKARRSPFLGLWWRCNARLAAMDGGRRVVVLVATYAGFRATVLALNQLHAPRLGEGLSWAWIAAVGYSWVAIPVFRRMLARELSGVRMRRGF